VQAHNNPLLPLSFLSEAHISPSPWHGPAGTVALPSLQLDLQQGEGLLKGREAQALCLRRLAAGGEHSCLVLLLALQLQRRLRLLASGDAIAALHLQLRLWLLLPALHLHLQLRLRPPGSRCRQEL